MSKDKKVKRVNKKQKICVTRVLRKELVLKQKNERDLPGMVSLCAQIMYLAKKCPCNTTYCLMYQHPLKVNTFTKAIKKALHTIEYGN